MENQKRGMASPGPITPNVKGKAHHPRYLTITVMRSVGKMRSFEISRRLILLTTVFFIAFILISLFVINRYFYLRRQNTMQSERIALLQEDLSNRRKLLNRSQKHLALLEDYIHNIEAQRELESEPEPPTSKKEAKKEIATSRSQPPKEKPSKEILKKVIDVTDVVIQKQGSRMTVDFKLVNVNPGEDAVGGYIHIIARNDKAGKLQEWTYPHQKLKNGLPVNFRRGLLFLIQRFKPIQGKFNLANSTESPSSVKVLVYNQSGEIILEKDFEVSNAS